MRIENLEQFPRPKIKERGINSKAEKNENVDSESEKKSELINAAYEVLGLSSEPSRENIDYLYHRTVKKKAKSILENGFQLKPDDAVRIKSGNGVYTVTNLEDSNNSYNKKYYGNYIVRIGYDASEMEWERGKKVDFMKLAKEGKHGNRRYDMKDVGEVAVLHDVDKIASIEISKDNGKTWEKSSSCINQITPEQRQQVEQLYFQYLKALSDKEVVTKEGFIDFVKKSTIVPQN